ncbi:RING-H2 finger protein [Quillaja saponaria]|uniref:RING-type E3 ubiquitin transferase n=1 Tax=Quillaja saponaria TaxID=32244 RepID=A0AAD7LD67_QUISA|nr:RING-H2 finger protein [Quillaja saponaria]
MGDVPSPFTPNPPSNPPKSNLSMLYYGLAILGTAVIVLAIYNLIIVKCCTNRHTQSQPSTRFVSGMSMSRSFENQNRNLLSSFKYKKEGAEAADQEQQGQGVEYECPVCLSVFEEGEEVRKLPRCKHSFHALCIDMWLYSHSDCPLCRSPVGPVPYHLPQQVRSSNNNTEGENSREGLLESGISV